MWSKMDDQTDDQVDDVVSDDVPEIPDDVPEEPTVVYKAVLLNEEGDLVSAIMPNMHAVTYRKGKKIKKVKTAQAFRFVEDARRFISDWAPYRTLQLWEAEAATVRPLEDALRDGHVPVENPTIYNCTGLKLVRRLDLQNLFE